MGTTAVVTVRRFYSQFNNGLLFADNPTSFSNNLIGSAGEKIKLYQEIQVDWWAGAINGDSFTFSSANRIDRVYGSFIKDGFSIGDTFDYCNDLSGTSVIFSGAITAITDLNIYYTVITGTVPSAGTVDTNKYMRGTNQLNGVLYNFGIIENKEPTNYTNKATGYEQGYVVKDVSTSITGVPLNNILVWETGGFTCSYIATTNVYFQNFLVEHIFTIPYYANGFEENYKNETLPSDFIGTNSLKYVCKFEFRSVFSNPNGSKIGIDDKSLGSVAFFNENFNGINSLYTFNSIELTDEGNNMISGLQKNGTTHAVIVIDGTFSLSSDYKIGIYHSIANEKAISNIGTTWNNYYNYDNAIQVVGNTGGNSDIIKNLASSITLGSCVIEFDIIFSDSQKNNIEQGDWYLLGVQVGDYGSLTATVSDKVILLDRECLGEYIVDNDVDGLLKWGDVRYYNHLQSYPDATHQLLNSQHDYKGWLEDGILTSFSFSLNLDLKTILKNIKVEFIAYNLVTNKYFVINAYEYALSSGIVAPFNASGYDAFLIDVQTKRDYNLPYGDQFNLSIVRSGDELKDIYWLDYECAVGYKIDWQDWIDNSNVSNEFVNLQELFKGRNQRSSRYNYGNWQLRFLYTVTVASDFNLITNYEFLSPKILIYNYNEDGNVIPKWVGQISTFTEDGLQNLSGRVLSNASTLFKCEWVWNNSLYGDMEDSFLQFYAIHRIEPHYASSSKSIEELSSIRVNKNDLLKPVMGEEALKLTFGVNKVYTECIIDHTKLRKGNYKLSARLFADTGLIGLNWEDINQVWEDITIKFDIL